jgi:hypothetical protein
MGFFSSLFGARSADAYSTNSTRNAIVSVSDSSNGQTSVSRYLENQPAGLSSVEKYLKAQEQNRPSGVAKYLARQAIAERNKPVVTLSGVEKYLKNNKDSVSIAVKRTTGVEKYLATQDKTPMSRVAKYALQKAIEERNAPAKPKATRVESYLQNLPETTTSSVSKYLAKQQAIAAATQAKVEIAVVVEAIVNDVALTGVEKYLKAQR